MFTSAYFRTAIVLLVVGSLAPRACLADPDLSSPMKTLLSLIDAMGEGDLEGINRMFVAPVNEDQTTLREFGLGQDRYTVAVIVALKAQFPNARLAAVTPQMEAKKKRLEESLTVVLDGDKARLVPTGSPTDAAELIRQGDSWLLVISPSFVLRPIAAEQVAQEKALKLMYVQVVQEIAGGKFSTVDAAQKAVESRRIEVIRQYMPPLRESGVAATGT